MEIKNIFENFPKSKKEIFEELINNQKFKLERIISKGQSSPENEEWYNQDNNEWVILLSGSAGLRFEGKKDVIVLKKGDYLNIPAHLKHRVEWTDKNQETIWLAIHY